MRGPASQNYSNSNNYYYQPQNANSNGYQPYYNNSYGGYQAQETQQMNTSGNDFSEYAWMVDQDEVEKKMMEELEQEEYIEACLEQLWMDEVDDEIAKEKQDEVSTTLNALSISQTTMTVPRITLNPNAQEFVPRSKTIAAN